MGRIVVQVDTRGATHETTWRSLLETPLRESADSPLGSEGQITEIVR